MQGMELQAWHPAGESKSVGPCPTQSQSLAAGTLVDGTRPSRFLVVTSVARGRPGVDSGWYIRMPCPHVTCGCH